MHPRRWARTESSLNPAFWLALSGPCLFELRVNRRPFLPIFTVLIDLTVACIFYATIQFASKYMVLYRHLEFRTISFIILPFITCTSKYKEVSIVMIRNQSNTGTVPNTTVHYEYVVAVLGFYQGGSTFVFHFRAILDTVQ